MKNFKNILFLFFISILFVGCQNDWLDLDYTKLYEKQRNNLDISLKLDPEFHQSNVRDLIVTNDKKEIITCGNDKSIRIFDLETKKEKDKILGEITTLGVDGQIYAIALSKDNKYLFSAGYLFDETNKNGLIRVYDYKTKKLVKILSGHINSVTELKVTEDGKYLFSMSAEDFIVWDLSTLQKIKRVETSDLSEFNHGTIVKNDNDYVIFIYKHDNSSTPKSPNGIAKYKLSEIVNPSYLDKNYRFETRNNYEKVGYLETTSEYLIVSEPKIVSIYNYDLKLIKTLKTNYVNSNILISPDEKILVLSSADIKNNKVYHLTFDITKNFKQLNRFNKHEESSIRMTFIDNTKIITAENNRNNSLLIWDVFTGKTISKIKSKALSIKNIAIDKKDKIIAFLNDKGVDKTFDLEKRVFLSKNISKDSLMYLPAESEAFHKSKKHELRVGKAFSKASYNDKLYFIENNRLKTTIDRDEGNGFAHDFAFFINDYIVSTSILGDIDIIDLEGNHLAVLDSNNKSKLSNATSDGTYLYTLSDNSIIDVWDLRKVNKNELILVKPNMSVFFDENNEWVMWTPQGYFNSSENGYKYIGFHINQGFDKEAKWVGIEKLYDHFYRPDLVELALKGEDITAYTKGLSYKEVLKNPAPKIQIIKVDNKNINSNEITYKKDEINLEFSVNQIDNGGVGIIRIYQEGKLVKTLGDGEINRQSANALEDLESLKINQKAKQSQEEYLAKFDNSVTKAMNGTIDESELINDVKLVQSLDNSGIHKISLPLKSGINKIEIEAFNKSNSVASIREKLNVDAKIKKENQSFTQLSQVLITLKI